MPDFRFAFYHDRNDTLENFKAGFGKNVSRIKIFLDELDRWKPVLYPFLFLSEFPLLTKENWFAQLTAWLRYRAKIFKLTVRKGSEYCRSAGLDEKEMELFNALSIFSAGKTLDQVSALEFLQVLLLLTREPLVSVKGIPGLRDLFLKIIRENKGEVLGIRPAGLNFQDGQIGGVEFQGREGIGCDRLIWNPESGGWPAEEGKRVFQFYFELDERIIAPAMSDFLVLKRGAESLSDSRNFICFALSERRVPEKGEENGSSGKRGLVAQVIADTGGRMEDQETLSRLVEERITWLLPFAEKHLKLCSSRAVQTEARVPSYFPPEAGKKAASIPKSPGPTVSLGRHFHYFPHPVAEHFVSPFLIKRGYDLAVRIKTGS